MRRLVAVLALMCVSACGGSGGAPASPPVAVVGPTGPLVAGLLTESQLRTVPGLSSARVNPLQQQAFFEEADARGPCGAAVPRLELDDAAAVSIRADTIRGGAQFVVRLPPGEAKRLLDARQANTSKGCPEFATTTNLGQNQTVQLVRVVRMHREFQQVLATVSALKVDGSVRAATQIEVRHDDILARLVIFSNLPLNNQSVRGLAALMARSLAAFDEE